MKDGLHENQLSKATLLMAIDQLQQRVAGDHNAVSPQPTSTKANKEQSRPAVSYFPSYEIVLDELRDYRFYAEDMVHPSAVAVEYIWERFGKTYFSEATQREMQPLHQLYLDRHHTLLHPDTPASQAFLARTEAAAVALRERYPWV